MMKNVAVGALVVVMLFVAAWLLGFLWPMLGLPLGHVPAVLPPALAQAYSGIFFVFLVVLVIGVPILAVSLLNSIGRSVIEDVKDWVCR